jgi:serine/threonine-protein kinase HipA
VSVDVTVNLWGTPVGYLGYEPGQTEVATFEFDEAFAQSGIQLSPIEMRHPPRIHQFGAISRRTFKGVPGICADSLPDKFGNQLIDLFMVDRNTTPAEITTLDRLLYVGKRGVGALEYEPSAEFEAGASSALTLDLAALTELAGRIARQKQEAHRELLGTESRAQALRLIRVGSSAGGARAKALVARLGDQLLDGTVDQGPGATYWLLKFDVDGNADRDGADPKGMTKVEYIYTQIAQELGLDVPQVSFIDDGDDFHSLIERFDRVQREARLDKLHYASWCGLAHADRDRTGAHGYEQLVQVVRELDLGQDAVTEVFRRALFNVVGRNHDDHTKNFGFLMNRDGEWRLAPAFDLTYAFDRHGKWTRAHQVRLNRKQDGFVWDDILAFGRFCNLTEAKTREYTQEVVQAMATFERRAQEIAVPSKLARQIARDLRLGLEAL